MRAKHPEMASDKAKMGLKWGVLAPESTRIIENEPLRQQRSCARWVFPQPAMRGADTFTEGLFTLKKLDDFVPANHPLRVIRTMVNKALAEMGELFAGMYEDDI